MMPRDDGKWPIRTLLLVWLGFLLATAAIDAALVALAFWISGVAW